MAAAVLVGGDHQWGSRLEVVVFFLRGHAPKITLRRDESSLSLDVDAQSPHTPLKILNVR